MNGKNDPYTSEYYLIEWLSSEENYSDFREPARGRTKEQVASEIADMINRRGTKVKRSGKDVMNKIGHIQKQMKQTSDWKDGATGQGILQSEGVCTFEQKVCLCMIFAIVVFKLHLSYSIVLLHKWVYRLSACALTTSS